MKKRMLRTCQKREKKENQRGKNRTLSAETPAEIELDTTELTLGTDNLFAADATDEEIDPTAELKEDEAYVCAELRRLLPILEPAFELSGT